MSLKIDRLIRLKTEQLNQLRQDLNQLRQLMITTSHEYDLAISVHKDYVIHIQALEEHRLQAVDMIERRRYLARLAKAIIGAADKLAEVKMQNEYALHALNQAYIEVKSLELIAERKDKLRKAINSRKHFSLADDEHIAHSAQAWRGI